MVISVIWTIVWKHCVIMTKIDHRHNETWPFNLRSFGALKIKQLWSLSFAGSVPARSWNCWHVKRTIGAALREMLNGSRLFRKKAALLVLLVVLCVPFTVILLQRDDGICSFRAVSFRDSTQIWYFQMELDWKTSSRRKSLTFASACRKWRWLTRLGEEIWCC